jgi:hypothetical protein
MSAAADSWERAHREARRVEATPRTRNALACRKRRAALRAAWLCVFCGRVPAMSLCDECQTTQTRQRRARDREARARLTGTPMEPRRYMRRKEGAE